MKKVLAVLTQGAGIIRGRLIAKLLIPLSLLIAGKSAAFAQHPIEVQRLAAKGEYFRALVEYEKLPKRRADTAAVTAAARSAWGLGLADRSISEYDRALTDETLQPVERARIYLSRAIIEFQEDRFQTSVLYAERCIVLLKEGGPLRAKAYLVWGNSLSQMGMYAAAEQKYLLALGEGELDDKPELHFRIAMVEMRLGKTEEARAHLEKVPLRHEHTPAAMRFLSQLALDRKNYKEAEFWLSRGRREYPDSFLDSWVDYVLMRIGISEEDDKKIKEVLQSATGKYPPSDEWLTLLKAASEAYYWGEKFE